MSERPDFWVASGHHLLDRSDGGGLVVTDDFLKAYLARPELVPPDEACPVERGLHAALLASPRMAVSAEELASIADADAAENFDVFLSFRDRLMAHVTLEQAYLAMVQGGVRGIPPLFLQQLVHVIARNAFQDCDDPLVVRAGECFYRPQRVTFHDKSVLLADHEAIEGHEHDRQHSPLMAMLGGPAVSELTVLNEENGANYWGRSDAHDLVFNLTSPTRGRHALGEAARIWIRHLTGADIVFEPVEKLANETFRWFLPFDAEATAIGNAVWNGEALAPEQSARVLALYRFTLPEDAAIAAEMRGKPAFAILATSSDNMLTIKPQNLIAGLPLARKDA